MLRPCLALEASAPMSPEQRAMLPACLRRAPIYDPEEEVEEMGSITSSINSNRDSGM